MFHIFHHLFTNLLNYFFIKMLIKRLFQTSKIIFSQRTINKQINLMRLSTTSKVSNIGINNENYFTIFENIKKMKDNCIQNKKYKELLDINKEIIAYKDKDFLRKIISEGEMIVIFNFIYSIISEKSIKLQKDLLQDLIYIHNNMEEIFILALESNISIEKKIDFYYIVSKLENIKELSKKSIELIENILNNSIENISNIDLIRLLSSSLRIKSFDYEKLENLFSKIHEILKNISKGIKSDSINDDLVENLNFVIYLSRVLTINSIENTTYSSMIIQIAKSYITNHIDLISLTEFDYQLNFLIALCKFGMKDITLYDKYIEIIFKNIKNGKNPSISYIKQIDNMNKNFRIYNKKENTLRGKDYTKTKVSNNFYYSLLLNILKEENYSFSDGRYIFSNAFAIKYLINRKNLNDFLDFSLGLMSIGVESNISQSEIEKLVLSMLQMFIKFEQKMKIKSKLEELNFDLEKFSIYFKMNSNI